MVVLGGGAVSYERDQRSDAECLAVSDALGGEGFSVCVLQGYLAHKKPPPPPRTTIGP